MRKLFLCSLLAVFAASSAIAVDEIEVPPPAVSSSSDGNAGVAFLFLAMIGIVVASGNGAFVARADNNVLMIEADDATDNSGF